MRKVKARTQAWALKQAWLLVYPLPLTGELTLSQGSAAEATEEGARWLMSHARHTKRERQVQNNGELPRRRHVEQRMDTASKSSADRSCPGATP